MRSLKMNFSFFLDSEETDFEKIKAASKCCIRNRNSNRMKKFLLQHLKAVQKKKNQRSLKRQKHRQRHIRHRQKQHRHLQAQKRRQQARANPHRNRLQTVPIRVDIEKLDALMNQVSELIIAKNSLVSLSDARRKQRRSEYRLSMNRSSISKESQRICMSPL